MSFLSAHRDGARPQASGLTASSSGDTTMAAPSAPSSPPPASSLAAQLLAHHVPLPLLLFSDNERSAGMRLEWCNDAARRSFRLGGSSSNGLGGEEDVLTQASELFAERDVKALLMKLASLDEAEVEREKVAAGLLAQTVADDGRSHPMSSQDDELDADYRAAWAAEGQPIEFRRHRRKRSNASRTVGKAASTTATETWWAEARVKTVQLPASDGRRYGRTCFSVLLLRPLDNVPTAGPVSTRTTAVAANAPALTLSSPLSPNEASASAAQPIAKPQGMLSSALRQDSASTTTATSGPFAVPSSERTPTLTATQRGEDYGGYWGRVSTAGGNAAAATAHSQAQDYVSSSGATSASATPMMGSSMNDSSMAPPPAPSSSSQYSYQQQSRRPSMPGLRLSHLPSPTLSSDTATASSRGSNRSLLSNDSGAAHSVTSAGSSVVTTSSAFQPPAHFTSHSSGSAGVRPGFSPSYSQRGSDETDRTMMGARTSSSNSNMSNAVDPTSGLGISVSSAGIHLSQSVAMDTPSSHATTMMNAPTATTTSAPGSDGDVTMSLSMPPPLPPSAATAHSPRPTSLPPPAPKPRAVRPDPSQLLRFATLGSLPKTGVIIADADLATGFVNPLARELLMGVPSRKYTNTTGGTKRKAAAAARRDADEDEDDAMDGGEGDDERRGNVDLDGAWWNSGWWSADDSWSSLSSGTTGTASNGGAGGSAAGTSGRGAGGSDAGSFFPPNSSHSDTRPNPFDGKDLMHSAIIASGEGKRAVGGTVKVGKPHESNRYRTTVAAILARSLVNEEKREAALRGVHSSRGGDVKGRWEAAGERPPLESGNMAQQAANSSSATAASSSASSPNPSTFANGPSFVGVGTKQGKKPYKVFDHSFSQRIIDPFEPLLDICARKGEYPTSIEEEDDPDAAVSGMIVGIEVEVWETIPSTSSSTGYTTSTSSAGANANDGLVPSSFVTSSSGTNRKKRVRRRLVEITAAPIFAPGGGPNGDKGTHLGGVLLLRDVTDEKRAVPIGTVQSLSTLRDSSKRKKKAHGDAYFKQIIDSMPQMVWTTTPLGSHDFFNQNWYDFTGLEPEQSLGLGWQSPFHEDDMPVAVKKWQHCLSTGDPYSVEYRCRRADGVWRWQLGRALPLRTLTGEIEAWFGTCTDVEEFVQIRSQLAKTQEQFKAIIEGAEVLIWAIDRDWTCTFFSHPNLKLVRGVNPVGRNILELWADSPLYGPCEQVMHGVVPRAQMEWVAIEDSFYRCLLTPLTERKLDGTVEITGVIVVSTDVTDLNLAQERLRKSYEDRAQLQASEAAANEASRLKSEFVANISHEIRTPIAGMIGMAELLLDETTLAEAHRVSIQKIMRSGEILLEMVGMVLDMGKVEAGKLELEHRAFKLEDVVSDARIFSIAASKKSLTFKEEIDPVFGGQVLGDMPRLRQVLANVLSNAIKFTKEGTITLRLHQESETRHAIRVRFEVEDTGVGIKEEAVPHLFMPFHQADASTARQYGGTGLGLCIARNLMELMGGSIDLESKYNVGTKMTVIVPLEKAPMTLIDMPAPIIPAGNNLVREDTWILVTDDNELNREIITKTLTKMRFNVESASDGLEAIAAVHRRAFDLVLMDGQMHTLDGYEATRRIRADPDQTISNVKIIALTASAIAGDREKCIACGMNDYLSKPVRSKVLEAMLLKHLEPPASPSRRGSGSGSATPGAETVALMSMNFETMPVVNESDPSNSRRRPSHPSYSSEAVTTPPLKTPPVSSLSPRLAQAQSPKTSYL